MKSFTFNYSGEPKGMPQGEAQICKVLDGRFPSIFKEVVNVFITVFLVISSFSMQAQATLQGTIDVETPVGGFAVDGDAMAGVPTSPQFAGYGDWFVYGDTPGGVFSIPVRVDLINGFGQLTSGDWPYENTFFFRDDITNKDPTVFTSRNKINDNPSTYTWGAGSSPDKNEIQNAMVHFTHDASGNLWVLFAADREVTNGSSYIDFEFLQNTLTRTGSTSGSFTSEGPHGGRTIGDILLTIEFTTGGVAANVVTQSWKSDGNGGYMYGNPEPALGVDVLFGTNNTSAIEVPYPVYNQSPSSPGKYTYSINQWAEGAANLTALFNSDPCFNISTLFVRTRTSGNSAQSELKDFPGGPVQLELDLNPDAELTATPACEGEDATFTATPADADNYTFFIDANENGLLDAGEDVQTGTSNTYTTSTLSHGDVVYVQVTTSSVCTDVDSAAAIIYDNPLVSNATDTFCDEDQSNTTLSNYDSEVGPGAGYTVSWFSDAARSVPVSSTGDLSVADSPHVFYATVTNDATDCDADATLTITINATPAVSNATDTFCDEDQSNTTLSNYDSEVGPGAGYTVSWFSDAARSVPVSSTGDLSVADSPHVFYATVTNDATDCDADATLTITINATPAVSNATDTFCDEDQSNTTLSNYDSEVGPGAGYTVSWFSDAARSVPVSSTGDLSVADSPHVFYATVTNDATDCDADATLTITINATPAVSNATDTFCDEDQSNTTLSNYDSEVGPGAGYTVSWFSDAARSVPVSSTGDLSVADSPHVFYATVTNDATDCDADATLTITINATPAVSNATDTFCDEDQSNTTLSNYDSEVGPGAGYTVSWFSDAARSVPVSSTGDLSVADSPHVFYATVTNDATDCDADATLTITINATPAVSNATDTFCDEDQSNTTLSNYDSEVGPGAGYTVSWFSDAARSVPVSSTGDLSVADSPHVFYATVTNDATDCDADATLTITINATPAVSNATDTFCDEDQSNTTLSNYDSEVGPGAGYTVSWFSDAARSVPVSSTGDLSVADSPHVFYATVTNDATDCDADATLTITINATPAVSNATDTFCDEDQSNTTLSNYDSEVGPGAGYTVSWFSDAARSVPVSSTGDLSVADSPHVFYATVTNDATDCDADATLTITINATPAVSNATDTFCDEDQSNTTLSNYDSEVGPGAGYTVSWFSDAARSVPVSSTGDLSVADSPHVFYATVTNDATDCDADATLTITINATPAVSNATDTFCDEDQSNTTLSNYDSEVGPGAGYTVSWFSDAARSVPVSSTGDLSVADSPHVFYATVTNDATDCDADATLTITINATPNLMDNTVCVNQTVNMGIGSGTYSSSNTSVATVDANGVVSGISVGNATITYTALNGCSDTATITVQNCIVDEGCTPGYWKNHPEAWIGANPDDNFFNFFGITSIGDNVQDITTECDLNHDGQLTLLEAISAEVKTSKNNGWFAALARHAVAAFLNASNPEVGYEFSTWYIIEETRKVFETDYANRNAANAAAQTLHNLFRRANERVCPLGAETRNSLADTSVIKLSESTIVVQEEEPISSSTVVSDFSVSPVPFKESLSVQYNFDYVSSATIQMFDMQGRLLLTQKEANASKGKITDLDINFRILPSQVYVIKVTTDRDVFTKKIISDK